MAEPILLIGAGGHAKSCIDVVEQNGQYRVVGLIGLSHEVGKKVMGYSILGSDNDLPNLLKKYPIVLIAVGQIKTAVLRMKLFNQIKNIGCNLPSIISPQSYVSTHAKVEEGSIVMHGAIVNAGATIGRNCIINTKALLEHDVKIGDHCHISTSSVINGHSIIGSGTFVGSGCRVRHSLIIGENCVLGMGELVLTNCADGSWIPRKAVVNERINYC